MKKPTTFLLQFFKRKALQLPVSIPEFAELFWVASYTGLAASEKIRAQVCVFKAGLPSALHRWYAAGGVQYCRRAGLNRYRIVL